MNELSNDDSLLLMELRSISERSAAASRFNHNSLFDHDTTDVASEASDPTSTTIMTTDDDMALDQSQHDQEIMHRTEAFYRSNAKRFLAQNPENSNFNQYWYSTKTIETLSQAILEILRKGRSHQGKRVAFLSTPSLYFALSPVERVHCKLFDYDRVWENDPGFVFYDYNHPVSFPDLTLEGSFDMVVIDPPFITHDVWKNYAITSRYLLEHDPVQDKDGKKGYVIGTTVKENKELMMDLFGATPAVFLPNCPHLVYQYNIFLNCAEDCDALKKANPEIEYNLTYTDSTSQ